MHFDLFRARVLKIKKKVGKDLFFIYVRNLFLATILYRYHDFRRDVMEKSLLSYCQL